MAQLNTTRTSSVSWSPDVTALPASEVLADAAVVQFTTFSANIEGDDPLVRIPVVVDDSAEIVQEGAEIDLGDIQLSERIVATCKVAQILKVSREQYNQENTSGALANAAARSVIAKADQVFFSQVAPTAPAVSPPAGLLNQGLTNGGTLDGDLDVLIDVLSLIQANGSTPTDIILSPAGWADLSKLKTATGSNEHLLGAGQAATERRLLGVPVSVHNALTGKQGFIIDRTDIVSAYGSVEIAVSDQVAFTSDSIVVRTSFRFGSTVVHPTRHARFVTSA